MPGTVRLIQQDQLERGGRPRFADEYQLPATLGRHTSHSAPARLTTEIQENAKRRLEEIQQKTRMDAIGRLTSLNSKDIADLKRKVR